MQPDHAPDIASLGTKISFLAAMPGVEEVIETRMALVFLTRDHAFKLKKPLLAGQSDCRTLAGRERAVAKEIWLNQPLAPGVYLGRLALRQSGDGLSLDGDGPVVDWLVQMRRLPRRWLLDEMIRNQKHPARAQIDALVERLVAFYRHQREKRPPRHLYALRLGREMAMNDAHLREGEAHLPRPEALRILDTLSASLRSLHPEIVARDCNGLVVDGHGDLRPEHVCLTDPPVIFDRAEAALELRAVDVWDECMSLAAESAMMGYQGLGGRLADALIDAGFQAPSPRLLVTYVQLHLVTRARLALDHLRGTPVPEREDWPEKAQHYLDAALALCRKDGLARAATSALHSTRDIC